MTEIKSNLIKLTEGRNYQAIAGDYLIIDRHTISDIIRFCVEKGDLEDVKFIVDKMVEKAKTND